MYSNCLSALILLPLLTSTSAAQSLPAEAVLFDVAYIFNDHLSSTNVSFAADRPDLLKRQSSIGSCPTNYISCADSLGQPGQFACCRQNQVCSSDAAMHVACCTSSSTCTGTITGPVTVSYVQNTYGFPFPYMTTSFADAQACSNVYSQCQSYSSSCTSALAGNAGGVSGITIVAPNNAAVTVASTTSLGITSASSICSSLSSVGCHNLQITSCQSITAGSSNAGPRQTANVLVMAQVAAGVGLGLGVAGQLL